MSCATRSPRAADASRSSPQATGRRTCMRSKTASSDGAAGKAPLVVAVHGGPNLSYGPTPWLEMSALAGAGFHVVWSNPRGSTGYGEQYARAVAGRWGEKDAGDIMRVADWAVEQGLADRDRRGVFGLSYGGFMTNWLLSRHPGAFKAAV